MVDYLYVDKDYFRRSKLLNACWTLIMINWTLSYATKIPWLYDLGYFIRTLIKLDDAKCMLGQWRLLWTWAQAHQEPSQNWSKGKLQAQARNLPPASDGVRATAWILLTDAVKLDFMNNQLYFGKRFTDSFTTWYLQRIASYTVRFHNMLPETLACIAYRIVPDFVMSSLLFC